MIHSQNFFHGGRHLGKYTRDTLRGFHVISRNFLRNFCVSCWPNSHLHGISRNFAWNVMAERTRKFREIMWNPRSVSRAYFPRWRPPWKKFGECIIVHLKDYCRFPFKNVLLLMRVGGVAILHHLKEKCLLARNGWWHVATLHITIFFGLFPFF